jgi:hypothetical protein
MRGGNTVIQTAQPSGAALISGGDVRMEGLDADGYLDDLAAGSPDVQNALSSLRTTITPYYTNSPPPSYPALTGLLSKGAYPATPGQEAWLNPIPGPNGMHAVSYPTA